MVKEVRITITDPEADPVELSFVIVYYDAAGNLTLSETFESDVDNIATDLGGELSTNHTTYGITDDIV